MAKPSAWIMIFGLMLTACLPAGSTQKAPNPASPSVIASPNATAGSTATRTVTETAVSPATATLVPSRTFTSIPSFTPRVATDALTLENGTSAPPETSTPQPFSIDRLPTGTVYRTIIIENRSRTHADISLHCTTRQGLNAVLEYTEIKTRQVEAPEGNYVYVVFVGGKQLIGSFSLFQISKLTITIYKDRVAIH